MLTSASTRSTSASSTARRFVGFGLVALAVLVERGAHAAEDPSKSEPATTPSSDEAGAAESVMSPSRRGDYYYGRASGSASIDEAILGEASLELGYVASKSYALMLQAGPLMLVSANDKTSWSGMLLAEAAYDTQLFSIGPRLGYANSEIGDVSRLKAAFVGASARLGARDGLMIQLSGHLALAESPELRSTSNPSLGSSSSTRELPYDLGAHVQVPVARRSALTLDVGALHLTSLARAVLGFRTRISGDRGPGSVWLGARAGLDLVDYTFAEGRCDCMAIELAPLFGVNAEQRF